MTAKNSSSISLKSHEVPAINEDDAATIDTFILDFDADQDCRSNNNGRWKHESFHMKTPNQDDFHPKKSPICRRRRSIKELKTMMKKKMTKLSVSFRLPVAAAIGRFVKSAKVKVESLKRKVRDRIHLTIKKRDFRRGQMFLVMHRKTLGVSRCVWKDRLDGRMNKFNRVMRRLDSPHLNKNDHDDIVKQYHLLCHRLEDLDKSFRAYAEASEANEEKVRQGTMKYSEWKTWKSEEFRKWCSDEVHVAKSILSFYSILDQILGPEIDHIKVKDALDLYFEQMSALERWWWWTYTRR